MFFGKYVISIRLLIISIEFYNFGPIFLKHLFLFDVHARTYEHIYSCIPSSCIFFQIFWFKNDETFGSIMNFFPIVSLSTIAVERYVPCVLISLNYWNLRNTYLLILQLNISWRLKVAETLKLRSVIGLITIWRSNLDNTH